MATAARDRLARLLRGGVKSALFTSDRSARDAAVADLEWLTGQWNLPS
jgi:hypothetical protein